MTTSENNFKNKYGKMYNFFFGEKDVELKDEDDDDFCYDSEHVAQLYALENNHLYTLFYTTNNLKESANFSIKMPKRSTDLSECDKFYELFFNKTQLNNDSNNKEYIDEDGIKYTSSLERNKNNNSCYFEMTYYREIKSKYF